MDEFNDFIPESPKDSNEIAEIMQNLALLQALSPYHTEESLIVAEFNNPEISHKERMELIQLADKCGNKKSHHTMFLFGTIAVSGLVVVWLRINGISSKEI